MPRQILVAVEEAFRGPSARKRRIQRLAFRNRSAFVAVYSCLSRAMRSKRMTSFSPILCSANDFRYSSWLYHLDSTRWMASMFALSCFLKHLLRSVDHHLSFRSTMFWSSTGILLNDKVRDRSNVAIGLVERCRTPRVRPISLSTALNDPDFGESIAIRDIDVLQDSRKVRRSLCNSCRRVIVVIPR